MSRCLQSWNTYVTTDEQFWSPVTHPPLLPPTPCLAWTRPQPHMDHFNTCLSCSWSSGSSSFLLSTSSPAACTAQHQPQLPKSLAPKHIRFKSTLCKPAQRACTETTSYGSNAIHTQFEGHHLQSAMFYPRTSNTRSHSPCSLSLVL